MDCTKAYLVKGQVGAETESSLILPSHALEEVPVSNCTEVLCWLEVAEKESLRKSSPVAGRPPVAARRMLNERHSVCCLPPVPAPQQMKSGPTVLLRKAFTLSLINPIKL